MHRGAWLLALHGLQSMHPTTPTDRIRCLAWQARCQLRLGLHGPATATAHELHRQLEQLDDSADSELARFWPYTGLLLARALHRHAQGVTATRILAQWVSDYPHNVPLKLQLAHQVIRLGGDWRLVRRIAASLKGWPSAERDVHWLRLRNVLYEGGLSADHLAEEIRHFSERYLQPASSNGYELPADSGTTLVSIQRQRIGLISPLFVAGPVYFLCIGALRELAHAFDLILYSRDPHQDWATDCFRSIAAEWHDVVELDDVQLAQTLRSAQLYAVIDLGGWMDQSVLRALARRPVSRQFKWVGGQGTTTGTHAFDGFITDEHQSPAHLAHLYTEPLHYMPGGYVTYTHPDYMPELRGMVSRSRSPVVGVMSHPVKVSVPFLAYLRQEIERHQAQKGLPVTLRFIGARYGQDALKRRITKAIGFDAQNDLAGVELQFVATRGHREQLRAIVELDWIIDTFPFTSGLTALEALALGVPLRIHAGAHCSARHAYSHSRYAGLTDEQIELQRLGAFAPGPLRNQGVSLLPPDSPRRDHVRLANSLVQLLHSSTPFATTGHVKPVH